MVHSIHTYLMPNLILIAGDGRNVGKTLFACQLIETLSKKHDVVGIKISPHFHQNINSKTLIYKDEDISISEEKEISHKDSSRFLQAGAQKVFFIMCKQENLDRAFEQLLPLLKDKKVVCESGGLHEFVKPGNFFFIKNRDSEIKKTEYLKYNPILLSRKGINFFQYSASNQITFNYLDN